MHEDILISVIVPAYNAEKTIKKSVNSILNQTYKNIELIVVNDGSSDNTEKVIKEIEDNRIKLISKKNEGPSIARNVGIREAKGDYITFLDADDYLNDSIFSKLVSIIKNEKYDVVLFKTIMEINGKREDNCKFSSFEFDEKEKSLLIKSIYNKFEKYNEILGFDGVQGKLINKDLIRKNNIIYPENTFRYEDAIFCLNLYTKANSIYFLAEDGTYYVQNPESICHKYNPKIVDTVYKALQNLYNLAENKQLFYIKCITTLSDCENLYFLNDENNHSKKQRKNEFKQMINKDLYVETLKKIEIKHIPIHYKVEVLLLRMKLYGIYLWFKKMHFKNKK